ncbi:MULTISPECIES: hypothetical protein [Streptomyces]|uniref:Uncharacterized protein n=1 Tax=Streptomyces virginiae TaxID=1961 RepID=A0ABQ3NE48_STRVG|nr:MULTISPECIES: hypothetical protein [Streptomyces]MBP2346282.1 hypothetical protein [Streptomyces virginiae]GGQ13892.1 hypothetical protein GCM10010215_43580 [Streptomyces virginiae]GHI10969.1 hypothetical protein Scinn_04320 [Streptomyces virginiae]
MRVTGLGGRLTVRRPARVGRGNLVRLVVLLVLLVLVLVLLAAMPLGRYLLVRLLVVRPRALRVLVHELRSERS